MRPEESESHDGEKTQRRHHLRAIGYKFRAGTCRLLYGEQDEVQAGDVRYD